MQVAHYKSFSKGFTLVEVIVVGVLISVLALGAFSLFNMYLNSTRETAGHLRLQRQSDALADEIALLVRNGACVLADGELCDTITTCNAVDSTTDLFNIQDPSNTLIRSFKIVSVNTTTAKLLNEDDEPFVVGGDTVLVDIGKNGVLTPFELDDCRVKMALNIRLKTLVRPNANPADEQNWLYLNVQRGAFRCRNNLYTQL